MIPRRGERLSPFRAGILALVVLVVGTYFAWTGRSPFAQDFELKAVVAGAPEVHSRTPVRVAGVDVGRVKHVDRGPGNAVTITMALKDSALPVHRDATVKIRTRLFLEGNFFLDLRPGTPAAPEMADGGVIPLSHTAVPVQLDEILADFRYSTRQNVRGLVGELAKAVDGGGAEAVGGSLPDLRPTFRNAAWLSEAARGEQEDDLPAFIRDSHRTAAAIASREAALPELVTGLNRTLRALASRRSQLEATLPELDRFLAEAHPALGEVRRLSPSARAFLREIRPGLRAAPPTLRLALPFLTEADRLLRSVPALLRQADPALASLARLEPRLAELLDLVTPVTECLRRNAIPTLKTPVDDPPHSTGEPVYKDLVHSVVGQASASQNFDGNGSNVRYHAGFGGQTISFGDVAGVSDPLVAFTNEPLVGSRPRRPAQQPPFRPDVPCTSQSPPDLRAETGSAPKQLSATRLRTRGRPATARELVRQARRRAARAGRRRR